MDVVAQAMEEKTSNNQSINTEMAMDQYQRGQTSEETLPSTLPSVAVVILNWNGRYFLEKFLPSVYNSTYPNLHFVVGDNGSTDDSVDFVRKYYPSVSIIQNDQNYGFAGGYNRVLEAVDADYFVLLNSDVEVTPDWIEPIIRLMESDASIGAVQPKLLAYHDKALFEHAGAAGGYIDAYGFPFCRGRLFHTVESDQGQYDQFSEIFWASGAAFFIKKSVWEKSGGFDEDFFAHMEEIDLCWRLRQMGYKVAFCPESTVYHVGGGTLQQSNPRKTFLNFRNNLFMLQKNLPFWRAVWVIFARLWFDLFALLHFAFSRKFADAAAVSRAHRAFFGKFFTTAKKRKAPIHAIGPDRTQGEGYYKNSIVFDYYIKGKRSFQEL